MKLNLKQNILTLIIGILIGAIITTGVFLIIKSNERNNFPDFSNRSQYRVRTNQNNDTQNEEETNIVEGE